MTKKEIMIKAHKMTKEIKTEYVEVNYSFQLGLCMSYLAKEGDKKEMVELQGSEKQVAWAEKIRAEQLNKLSYNIEEWDKTATDITIIKNRIKEDTIAFKISLSMMKFLEIAKEESSAKFWIEHRNIAEYAYSIAYNSKGETVASMPV